MDVIVIGAGIIGAAVARELTRSGIAVTVIERGAAASATSASGEGNVLVSDKEPGPELVLAQYSARLWPQVARELADELGGTIPADGLGGGHRAGSGAAFPSIEFDRKGGLVVATTDAGIEPLRDFAATQVAAGVDARPVTLDEARELEPDLTPSATAAVYYPEDAQVQPVIATEALLASARRSGASVLEGTEVTGGLRGADGRLSGVRTTAGDLHADAVVTAAGPWSAELTARLGAPVPVQPRRGVVLVTSRMRPRIFHKVYDADYVDAVGSGDAALQTSSVIESTAAGTVLIGSSRQRIGFDDRLRVAVLREIAAKAANVFPFLADTPAMRCYGGFRPFVPDHLPLIGADPRLPGLWHATGHEGAGIGLSVATAALLRDLMTGTEPAIDALPFSPARPSLAEHLQEVM
ncbi:FAD-binding oxidoreductase [Actinobacteria bacterium YIM 96077]|uniref:FAD-dependent oxidoreductase n=1 Tax=Phytoactinopolyspora halophila TaxID=1981511 RepID=A0A329QE78_9ACTN|nr:FAD-dependent oxidoreductase [Phytoactinopolyspora halophila]AYY13589.1 FAD-binding oxidoreductase [Actinobacteria bacterium YIM 96077]RAW10745.1 FAD-dependent oxidoreductase [Phytoactinopolyspora halophila]